MLSHLLNELRENSTLARLPLSPNAFMVVEEFDNRYFWPMKGRPKATGRIKR